MVRKGISFVNDKKKRKIIISVIILVLIAAVILCAAIFIKSKLDKIQYSDGSVSASPEEIKEAAEKDSIEIDVSELEKIDAVDAPEGEVRKEEGILNVLLLGTDERSYEFNENARADCIIILSINFDDTSAKLISLERGMGVKMYGGMYEGKIDLLTHCFRWGGAELMLKEVQEYFNLDIDRYVRVNFTALARLVDCLGGIDIELSPMEVCGLNDYSGSTRTGCYNKDGEYVTYSEHPQPLFEEGVNHMYGPAALAYARMRCIDSDWHRIERQRNVIQACVDSVKDADIKTLNSLCDEILPMIETNITQAEIMKLMLKAPKFLGISFDQLTIPVNRDS